jgi:BMFP domain-containing protein YqiC
MHGIIKRAILSGIDIQRGILDYAEQVIEKGIAGMEKGERPLERLVAKVRENKDYLEETVRDLVERALHTGLHQLDDKLDELNERISALEKKKAPPKPRTARKRKPTTKKPKPAAKKRPPVVDEEPIIDG